MRETRCATIAHHVDLCVRTKPLAFDTFAEEVRRLYFERTPLHARRVPLRETVGVDNAYAAMRHNGMTIARMLGLRDEHPVRLPSELEEACVLALPEPYRRECLRELAARYGLMPAALPSDAPGAQLCSVADLLRECGETVVSMVPIMHDGRIGPEDAPLADRAIAELDQVIAAATSLREQVRQAKAPAAPAAVRVPGNVNGSRHS